MMQLDIFDCLYEQFKINKKIRLIELFAGIGSQAQSLKNIGANFEHHRICEWAIPSIIAYASIHRDELPNYGEDYCSDLSKYQVANELASLGVSADYNKPATLEQLKRMSEDKLKLIYNSIMWENNLVDITRVRGCDLGINEQDKYMYICSYSFPCQNLSLAGKQDNLKHRDEINEDNLYDESNRSNMLWQVERILKELSDKGITIDCLLLENVQQLVNENNKPMFQSWIRSLESMGYKTNLWDILNAKDYGIPQNRVRCFMVSFNGNYTYTFPKKKELKLRLKDLLESNVDEKYYLSEKMIQYCTGLNQKDSKFPRGERFIQSLDTTNSNDTATCISTNAGNRPVDNFIADKKTMEKLKYIVNGKTSGGGTTLMIKNATKKGYLEAYPGDGVDVSSRMESHRGTVQKGLAQTLKTQNEVGVVVDE